MVGAAGREPEEPPGLFSAVPLRAHARARKDVGAGRNIWPGENIRAGEHRRDDGDVRQVGAAGERIVECVPDPFPAQQATAAGIEPRCTGMCSACMTISPSALNSAVEASRRSLMFEECAERISTTPISSQAARRAPVSTCSSIGSSALIGQPAGGRFRGRPPSPTSLGGLAGWTLGARRGPARRGARRARARRGRRRPRRALSRT